MEFKHSKRQLIGDGDQFQKALEVLFEMKGLGLRPNSITFSILIVASEK